MAKTQLTGTGREYELMSNPSYICESNGIYYPVLKILDGNHGCEQIVEESPLELGLDPLKPAMEFIREDPVHNFILANIGNTPFDGTINVLDAARNLAQLSGHNFYSVSLYDDIEIVRSNNERYFKFKPRLFRRIVDN